MEGKTSLNRLAFSATAHCLTGCAIGEVLGLVIGTILGWGTLATIVLAVVLAFFFGYSLTMLPLLRSGLAFAAAIPIALTADTVSIAVMELVDNAVLLVYPGALDAGLGDALFWGSLALALAVAFVLTLPVNRWMIARGKGHAAVHETGIHGGLPPKVVGAIAAAAFLFGSVVLLGEAFGEDEPAHEADPHTALGRVAQTG